MGDPAGRVLDAIRFHSLGAILNWLAGSFCLDLMSLVFLVRELTELVSILWHSSQMKHWRVCVYCSFFLSFSRGGGGAPLYKLYKHVPPHQVGFLRRFGLKTGNHTLCPFWSGVGCGFWGNYGSVWTSLYRFNSKWVRKKEKYTNWNRIWRIFFLRSNLSNDNIISVQRPGLKTGVENYMVWNSLG